MSGSQYAARTNGRPSRTSASRSPTPVTTPRFANPGAIDLASLGPATSQLSQFFGLLTDTSWLTSANPFASFAQSVDVGGLTLSLGGDISGTQFLLGWDGALVPDGGPITPGVRVRQISAVLNIGIALADSGANTSVALVSGANTTNSSDVQALLSTLSSTQGGPRPTARRSLASRPAASAVGSDAVVKVCQAFHDALSCAPDPGPTVEPVGPVASDPQPVATQQAVPAVAGASAADPSDPGTGGDAGSLPFTGSDPQALVLTALGLIGAGGVLARKRRAL